jgi:DNA-binding MarR family transcriptional regulator
LTGGHAGPYDEDRPEEARVERDLCSIRDIVREIHRLEAELKRGYGLTLNEGLCLCCITGVGRTPGDCARQLGVSASRISRIINALERKGLLQRSLGPDDRRSTDLAITDKGRQRLRDLRGNGFSFSRLDALVAATDRQ